MTIIKIEKRADPYARIDNRTLQDERLSLKARGLLAFLLSLPCNWHIVLEHLVKVLPDGRYVIRSAFDELQRYGYAELHCPRDERGRFGGRVWIIRERPGTEMTVFPLSDNSIFGKLRFSEKSATTNEINPSNPITNKRAITKLLAPDGERELLGQIGEILGAGEIKKNGGMWRKRIRAGSAERRALRNTTEDYRARSPHERQQIRNLPAWFTDRYRRNLLEVNNATQSKR